MTKVCIGVDPRKLSTTIEVVDDCESVLTKGRFARDKVGYSAMRKTVSGWPERVWAVEGSNGAPGDRWRGGSWPTGSTWLMFRPKTVRASTVVRHRPHRKTDAHDAHAVAVVAVRTSALRVLAYDDEPLVDNRGSRSDAERARSKRRVVSEDCR